MPSFGSLPVPETWTERLAQIALGLLLLTAVVLAVRWLTPVLAPVLISVLIAYILDPLIDWFEARKIRRWLAILVIALCGMSGMVGVLFVLLHQFPERIGEAVAQLPERLTQLQETWGERLSERFGLESYDKLAPLFSEFSGQIAGQAQRIANQIGKTAIGSLVSALNVFVVIVFTFFFLRDFDKLKMKPLTLVPPRYRQAVITRTTRMDYAIGRWLRGQVKVAAIMSVLLSITLHLCGLPNGMIVGILAGMLNVIPFLGFAVGLVLIVLMMILYTGDSAFLVLGSSVLAFVVLQTIESNIITPKIVGDSVGMSSLTVLILVLFGGSFFGFVGVLLAIPSAAAGSVLLQELLDSYRSSSFYRGEASDGDVQTPTPDASEQAEGASHTATLPSSSVRAPDNTDSSVGGESHTTTGSGVPRETNPIDLSLPPPDTEKPSEAGTESPNATDEIDARRDTSMARDAEDPASPPDWAQRAATDDIGDDVRPHGEDQES